MAADTLEGAVVVVGTPRERPTGLVCFYRPNRAAPRQFSAQDAARIACNVIGGGRATLAQITARIKAQCPAAEEDAKEADAAEAREVMVAEAERAVAQLQQTDQVLQDALGALLVVAGVLALIATVGLLFAPARAARVAALPAIAQVATTIRVIGAVRPANQAAYAGLTRAVALLRKAA